MAKSTARKRKNAPAPDLKKFTADQIVMRKVDDLVPFPNNPKIHTPEQIAAIEANIKAFGFDQPILVDENDTILKGHGRQLAARNLGIEVPTIVHKGLSPADKWAIVISDNVLPAMTGLDKGLLRIGLTTLAKLDYDLNLTGYDNVRLATFGVGENAGQSDPDEEVEPAAEPISGRGDIWLLGSHRIICGNSTKKEDVAAVLGKDKPHLMVTDPPYGVNYDPNWRNEPEKLNVTSKTVMVKKTKAVGKVVNDDRADWQETWGLFEGDVAYVWCGERQSVDMARQLFDVGIETRNLIVWAKAHHVISRGHYHPQHETCWYGVRKGATAKWSGDRSQSTLWQIPNLRIFGREDGNVETGHSTQKPIECMKRPIENNSKPGDCVYEPFAGSGTTIIAAEMTGRACLAIEISPLYVDVCVRRWETFTGKKATLQGTKRTFDQVEKERSRKAA